MIAVGNHALFYGFIFIYLFICMCEDTCMDTPVCVCACTQQHTWLFTWVLEIELGLSLFFTRELYQLNHGSTLGFMFQVKCLVFVFLRGFHDRVMAMENIEQIGLSSNVALGHHSSSLDLNCFPLCLLLP